VTSDAERPQLAGPEYPPGEGELLTSADAVWIGHLVMEMLRTASLVVIAVALVVIA